MPSKKKGSGGEEGTYRQPLPASGRNKPPAPGREEIPPKSSTLYSFGALTKHHRLGDNHRKQFLTLLGTTSVGSR